MAYFQPALDKTLAHEGGFVNDPKDPGGMTFCGISRKAFPSLYMWELLDKDPQRIEVLKGFEDWNDLNSRTDRVIWWDMVQKDIYAICYQEFWTPLHADAIESQEVANWLFDFAFNSGTTDAVKALQSVVGVKVDGIIGKATLTAVNSTQIDKRKLQEARLMHYMACIAGNPELIRFGLGWVRRALA